MNTSSIVKRFTAIGALSAIAFLNVNEAKAQISSATITVSAPSATAPTNVAYCAGATTTAITLTGSNSATFNVSGGTGIGLNNLTGVTSIPAFLVTNATNATIAQTITITPTNGTCEGTPVSFTLSVVPVPTIAATAPVLACNGTPVTAISFTGTNNPAGTVYSWTATGDAVGLATTSGTASIAGFTLDNTTAANKVAAIAVSASYTDAGRTCASTGNGGDFTITAYPKPNATITGVTPICSGVTAQVTYNSTAGTGPFDVVISDGTTPNTYNSIANGAAISLGMPSATITYDLTKITDANGCINQ
ncbi:hypothetical protein [Taibaiella koreensis]|uniref:hypothetical protein n=1 Tax=Taibaiella koreensis TaxID=1268548 RepID=UPI0013C2A29C|nr:hypothetical protein [Taibaiella koreensis]